MKATTKKEANKIKKELLLKGKNAQIFKFANKRKFQFFIGTWWEWMSAIS